MNSQPIKKGNTAAIPPRDTEVKGVKDQEVMSQQLREDFLMAVAVFMKHGLLDKLKEQLPHNDLNLPSTQFPTETYVSSTIPITITAAVTPSHVLPLREEMTTANRQLISPILIFIHITDPPQLNNVSTSESDKQQYPVLLEVHPHVRIGTGTA